MRNGQFNKALQNTKNTNLDSLMVALIQILNKKVNKDGMELTNYLESIDSSFDHILIQVYNAAENYQKADSVANVIDSQLLGHCTLAMNTGMYGLNFHLSATPNFAARLTEMGIDTAEFQKEKYYRFVDLRK